MSYDIIYDKQFVKLPNNNFIPMILSGCNNLIEYSNSWRGGRGRRSRSWESHSYVLFGSDNKFFASGELILKNVQKTIDNCVERNANVKKDYDDKIYTEYEVKQAFGYFEGLAVRTQSTGKCTAANYFNIYKNGIKDALTIEELDKLGIHINFHVYDWNYKFSIPLPKWNYYNIISTEQFFEVLKQVQDYMKNCVVTNSDGKIEQISVHIQFNGSDRLVSEKLKGHRKHSKKKPVRYDYIEQDHFYTLENEKGYLWKYTASGYKYSPMYPQRHFRTEKEANTFKAYLIRTKKSYAESWKVTLKNSPYKFKTAIYA